MQRLLPEYQITWREVCSAAVMVSSRISDISAQILFLHSCVYELNGMMEVNSFINIPLMDTEKLFGHRAISRYFPSMRANIVILSPGIRES